MDRIQFCKVYGSVLGMDKDHTEALTLRKEYCDWKLKNQTKTETLLICIEELSELQKELTKYMRSGEVNAVGILEELADVEICKTYIETIFEMNTAEIDAAILTKVYNNYVVQPNEIKFKDE